MECSEFLERFSDYFDDRADAGVIAEMDEHLSRCADCRRYHRTMEEGLRLARELPALDVPRDFRARLKHRIYHLEDGSAIARQRLGSGATAFSVLAIAVLMAVVAWIPTREGGLSGVDLPPLVVSAPPPASVAPGYTPPTLSRSLSAFTSSEFQEGIWGDPHRLLFRYSPISERRQGVFPARLGLQ
jgi:predicted anti-sigma-YlaC factor YlaD